MKKHLILLSLSTIAVLATSTTEYREFLSGKSLEVSGTFGSYDFMSGFAAGASMFDWAFTTTAGVTYQLRGDAPSDSSVFGWKVATIAAPTPQWYMMYAESDIDGDGTSKFDWILVSPATKAVYKLAGVSESGSFAYSDAIDIDYTISSDGLYVSFEGGNTQSSQDEDGLQSVVNSDGGITTSLNGKSFRSPSKELCEEHGGTYSEDKIYSRDYSSILYSIPNCYTSWSEAQNICASLGGNLPTAEELGAIVTECGGNFMGAGAYDYDTVMQNTWNDEYQNCYKTHYFYYAYWTSDEMSEKNVYKVSFNDGDTVYESKTTAYDLYVRCVNTEDGESVESSSSSNSSESSTSDFYQSIDLDSIAFRKPTQSECEAGGGTYGAWMDDECYASWESANKICEMPSKDEWLALAASCGADVSFVESTNVMFDENGWYGLTSVSGISQCIFSKIDSTQNTLYFWSSSESEYDASMAWYFSTNPSSDYWDMNDYPKGSDYKVRCKKSVGSTTTTSSSSSSVSSSIANTTTGSGKATFMMKDFPTCQGEEGDGQTYTLLEGMVSCADVGLTSDYTGTMDLSGTGFINDYSFADTSDGFCVDYQYTDQYASGKTCMIQMDLE